MSQPTLAHIPGILLRTALRSISRIILVLASGVLLFGIALALLSLLIATWRTPRDRRTTLVIDTALLATELVKDWRHRSDSD